MKNYMVTMAEGEAFLVPVIAANPKSAIRKARREFKDGNYSETGEFTVHVLGIGENKK